MKKRRNMRNISKVLVGALLCLTVSSCGIYGKYRSSAQTDEAIKINVPSYREIFRDSMLLDLIDSALVRNYDLRMAQERVKQANAQLTAARLAYLPRIYAGGNPVISVDPSKKFDAGALNYSLGTLSWEIDIFGRVTNRKRIAKMVKQEMEDLEQACRCELVASVATLYYSLQNIDAQILATDAAEQNWASSVQTIKAMKQAGIEDEAGVSQFEGSYYATRASGKALRLLREVNENAMRMLLCESEGKIERGSITNINSAALDTINLNAVRARPDVRAAEMRLAQAFYNANLARANCCPQIEIGGSIGWGNKSLIYGLIGGLLQPVFNAGENIAQVKVGESRLEEYKMAYANALLNAGNEVNNALATGRVRRSEREEYLNRVEAMERALKATQLKMKYGRGTYLEVLSAQNSLLEAQIADIQNACDILSSSVELYRALGGGR